MIVRNGVYIGFSWVDGEYGWQILYENMKDITTHEDTLLFDDHNRPTKKYDIKNLIRRAMKL